MRTEPATEAESWPYALTLTTPDGPREFRFRVDPVEPEKPFRRAGNPLRESPGEKLAGMIVAERRVVGDHLAGWLPPTWAEVVALAFAAKDGGLGRLGSHPTSFLMPPRGAAAPLLNVTEVRWSRWKGEALVPDNLCALPGFEVTERGAARVDTGETAPTYGEVADRMDPSERELILFVDDEGELDAADQEMIDDSAKYLLLVRRACRAEELLGEAIEALEERGLAEEWCAAARPFARFREDAVDAKASTPVALTEAERDRQRLAEDRDLVAQLSAAIRALEDRNAAKARSIDSAQRASGGDL